MEEKIKQPLRLLLVEDDNLTRVLLVRILTDEGFELFAYGDGASAIAALEDIDVDIALVDLNLGAGPTGVDVLRAIRRGNPEMAAVVLTSFHSTQLVDPGMTGLPESVGHLVKSELDSEGRIVEALLEAVGGRPGSRPTLQGQESYSLTRAQAELLRLVGEGLSNSAIAELRQTTVRATEILLLKTYEALGIAANDSLNSRVQAAIMYRDSAIVLKSVGHVRGA